VRLAVVIVAIILATLLAFAYATLTVVVLIIATLSFPSLRGGERCVIKVWVRTVDCGFFYLLHRNREVQSCRDVPVFHERKTFLGAALVRRNPGAGFGSKFTS
jgi:hypothetical protein